MSQKDVTEELTTKAPRHKERHQGTKKTTKKNRDINRELREWRECPCRGAWRCAQRQKKETMNKILHRKGAKDAKKEMDSRLQIAGMTEWAHRHASQHNVLVRGIRGP